MALHMDIQTSPGGTYTAIDLVDLRIAQIKLDVRYRKPAALTFVMYQPQQSLPLGINNFLRFWDDAAHDSGGNSFSAGNPIFEGFIDQVSPGDDAHLVSITCQDPTQKASKEIPIMSTASVPGNPPTDGIGAVPRVIFAAPLPNDDDFIFSRGPGLTTGNMLAQLFDDATPWLRYWNAAPASGTPYDPNDLNDFTYIPQEKVVLENEPLRGGIDSLLRWEPAVRLIWTPGTRIWHFVNLYNSPSDTLTLNDFSGAYRVLSFQLHRSQAGRYTAVRIYGPETLVQFTASTLDGSLTLNPTGQVLETYSDASGMHDALAMNTWQITDPLQRRIGRLLPIPIVVNVAGVAIETIDPTLEVSYDAGSTWLAIPWASLNWRQGIVTTGSVFPYIHITPPSVHNSSQTFFPPTGVRFTFAYYATPIEVRIPSSGYSGTAFSIANVQTEFRLYDEMLAVGYDPYAVPVTTNARIAQYEVLAAKLLQQRQDLIYTGTVVLDGLIYEFVRLNRRINIAGKDGSGATVATGWEAVGAFVTDVEFDYDQMLTTIQFSSDQLELMGFDPAFLRARLKIRALQLRQEITTTYLYRDYQGKFSPVGPQRELAGVHTQITPYYIDPTNPQDFGHVPLDPHAAHGGYQPNFIPIGNPDAKPIFLDENGAQIL